MDFDLVVKNRRSVRSFDPSRKVKIENMAEILDAARYAPSSGNLQNWSFILVESQEKKQLIANAFPKQEFLINASFLVIVLSRQENIRRYYGTRGEMLYAIQNCSAAIENMLLKATDLGIASCWINAFEENMIKREFSVPEDVRVQAVLAFGYSSEPYAEVKRYDLGLLVSFESWGQKKGNIVFPLAQKAIPRIEEKFEEKKGFLKRLFKKGLW